MDIFYHCITTQKKDPSFGIVMFADNVKEDSIYEHAISQFDQYPDIHYYGFLLEDKNVMETRSIFYMKLYSILEYMMDALTNKTYDWLFLDRWRCHFNQSKYKIRSIYSPDHQDDFHLVISDEYNGLNGGVFLILFYPCSLDFMIKTYSYCFYNLKLDLVYYDQSSMLHVLQEMEDDSH